MKMMRCENLLGIWGVFAGNSGLTNVVEVKDGLVKKRAREERGINFDRERFLAPKIISLKNSGDGSGRREAKDNNNKKNPDLQRRESEEMDDGSRKMTMVINEQNIRV